MAESEVLRIHVGLDAVTVILGDETAASPVETLVRQPGWAEQRPDDWWTALADALAELRDRADLSTVTTIEVTRELRGWVLLDGEREVIRPAILDSDARCADGPPLAWLRQNETIAYKRIQHILTPRAWLRFRLTSEIGADAEDTEDLGLLDDATGQWSVDRCDELEINLDLLPEIAVPNNSTPLSEGVAGGVGVRSIVVVR